MVRTRLDALCWPWSCKACLSLIPLPGKQRRPKTSGRKGRAQEATVRVVSVENVPREEETAGGSDDVSAEAEVESEAGSSEG